VSPSPDKTTPKSSSPASPTPPVLRAPPTPGGRGSHGDIREKPCPGAALPPVSRSDISFPEGQAGESRSGAGRKLVLPRDLPVQWTVVAIATGGGGQGGGLPPSPKRRYSPSPPPRPRSALLHRPRRAGAVTWRYRGKPCPGVMMLDAYDLLTSTGV